MTVLSKKEYIIEIQFSRSVIKLFFEKKQKYLLVSFMPERLLARMFNQEKIIAELNEGLHFYFITLDSEHVSFYSIIYYSNSTRWRFIFEFLLIGLDPADPGFTGRPEWARLDATDAAFVDVIHTDASKFAIVAGEFKIKRIFKATKR